VSAHPPPVTCRTWGAARGSDGLGGLVHTRHRTQPAVSPRLRNRREHKHTHSTPTPTLMDVGGLKGEGAAEDRRKQLNWPFHRVMGAGAQTHCTRARSPPMYLPAGGIQLAHPPTHSY
jgi:hypothetical protein